MTDHVAAAGAYLPRFRITADELADAWDGFEAANVDQVAVPATDEDSVTMAVEAAQEALGNANVDREDVGGLAFASTTPPIDEGDVAARIAEILGLGRGLDVSSFTQSTRAGTRALVTAARMLPTSPTLAVVADAPQGPPDDPLGQVAGAGAVALVLAPEGPVAVEEVGHYVREFSGTRFRERGSETIDAYGATAYERDAYTSVVAGAVEQLETVGAALAPSAHDGSMPYRATRDLDADPDVYQLASELGDTGAASPLFGLLAAWQDDASPTTVVGYGAGASADAVRLSGTLDVAWDRETETVSYAEYARKRGHVITGGEN